MFEIKTGLIIKIIMTQDKQLSELNQRELEERDENISILFQQEKTLANMLQVLEVNQSDDTVFLDGVMNVFLGRVISWEQYFTLKKYIDTIDFTDKCRNFISQSAQWYKSKSFSDKDIWDMMLDTQEHFEWILQKYKIFEHLDDVDALNSQYRLTLKSEQFWTILVPNDNNTIYLINKGLLYTCDEQLLCNGEALYLFILYDQIVILNWKTLQLFSIPWVYRWSFESNWLNWINASQGNKESITILESRDHFEILKYTQRNWWEITRFQDIYWDIDWNIVWVVVFWIEFYIANEWNIESWKETNTQVRKKYYENLADSNWEIIFTCYGEILDVTQTSFDTFILYEQEYYDQDSDTGTTHIRSVYSLNEQDIVLELQWWKKWKYVIVKENDNYIILNHTLQWDYIMDLKSWFSASEVHELSLDKNSEYTMISFTHPDSWEKVYICTNYSSSSFLKNPETWVSEDLEFHFRYH